MSRADVTVFQEAGPAGERGVLTEGDFFPPTNGGFSSLRRGEDRLQFNLHTTGLPPGAYTNWWVIWNDPSQCSDGVCGPDDFFNAAADFSVFWATGGMVESDGVGNFRARISEGEDAPGPDGFIAGNGLTDAENATVMIILKYHGLASDDPDEVFLQTHTLLGLCDDRANAKLNGNCFDPQWVTHHP